METQEQPLQNEQQKQQMLDVLDEYFNRGVETKKFIDVNRIPLICQDISVIHTKIEDMNTGLKKIQDNISWAVRIILGAVVLALIRLVIKK